MDLARKKLKRITHCWNYFFWDYKVIQKKIRWNEEVKKNYYADIFSYFDDTFDLIERKPKKSDFQDSIFYATGLLQTIYVHQDFTDELLRIFKLIASSKKDKGENREIRNELIGHPIRRDKKNELISSVFWGENLTTDNLHYIKYTKDDSIAGEEKIFKIKDIIASHRDYLNKYFDIILEKIRKILKKYAEKIKELESELENNIDFDTILSLTLQRYESIFKSNRLYNVRCLKECNERRDEHERYKYAVDCFKQELKENLIEKQSHIEELISKVKLEKETIKSVEQPKREFRYVTAEDSDTKIEENKKLRDYDYHLGKLYEKIMSCDIFYFKKIFKDNSKIMEELDNMEINMNNSEYYISYNYLSYLIKNRI